MQYTMQLEICLNLFILEKSFHKTRAGLRENGALGKENSRRPHTHREASFVTLTICMLHNRSPNHWMMMMMMIIIIIPIALRRLMKLSGVLQFLSCALDLMQR
jgi:hypothetical protein